MGQHSVSAGLFIYFHSNRAFVYRTVSTFLLFYLGGGGVKMALLFHSSLINRETNFGLNVSKTL